MKETATHKLTSVLLAFVLAFSMFGVTSLSALTDTAWGEETEITHVYNKEKISPESGYYQLDENITLENTYTVNPGIEIAIDLNGKTLTGPNNMTAIQIEKDGCLTIVDSAGKGIFAGRNSSSSIEEISNLGKLTLQGGAFSGSAQRIVNNTGELVIYGGEFNAASIDSYAIYNNVGDNSKVFIYGGTFTNSGGAAAICNNSEMMVTDGTFIASAYGKPAFENKVNSTLEFNIGSVEVIKDVREDTSAAILSEGTLIIHDGTFKSTYGEVIRASDGSVEITEGAFQGLYPISYAESSSPKIFGGTFVAKEGGKPIRAYEQNEGSNIYKSVVSGGAFSHSVGTYLASDFTAEVRASSGDTPYSYNYDFTGAVRTAVLNGFGETVSAVKEQTVVTGGTGASVVFKDGTDTLATVYQDTEQGIVLPTLKKEGNTFYGWNDGTTTNRGGRTYKLSNIDVGSSVTLTAQWTPPETEEPIDEPKGKPDIVVIDEDATGITVDTESELDATEDDKVRLEVSLTSKKSDEYKTIAVKVSELSDLTGVYDATLFVNGVKKTDGFGSITLMFPVDSKYNDRLVRVWYIHEGEEPGFKHSVCVDGKVSFGTSQLSVFGVEILDPSEYPSPEKPDTKDPYTQEMYRLYNPNSGEHFYTADEFERDCTEASGWSYEGVAWIAPIRSNTPVYRLYSGTDHHYTTSSDERDMLVNAGWLDEGIGWYSDDAEGMPLFRLFNPNVDPSAEENNSGSHHYTANKAESSHLANNGWIFEYIGWYGVKDEAS